MAMNWRNIRYAFSFSLFLFLLSLPPLFSAEIDQSKTRGKAALLMQEGNFKEAYTLYTDLVADTKGDSSFVSQDFLSAISCLRSLGRIDEFDDFVEKTIAAHQKNWRLLAVAAKAFLNVDHYGVIVAGRFTRGPHRGQAKQVNAYPRDRVRSIQLYLKAISYNNNQSENQEKGSLYFELSTALLRCEQYGRGVSESWRLQYLTDLEKLPEYDEEIYRYWHSLQERQPAPVEEDGSPLFYRIPADWAVAKNDGERWRWSLAKTVEYAPNLQGRAQLQWAGFLRDQFDVSSMARYRTLFARLVEEEREEGAVRDESGPYAVHTLAENETIARLATGIKRFFLPDEYNFIQIYQEVAKREKYGADQALRTLAEIFENRMQYDRAAEYWRRHISLFGERPDTRSRLEQIVGNWGQLQPTSTNPSGTGATVEYRFRNGRKVDFTAHEINLPLLLSDVKAYIKSNPKSLDWNQMEINHLGYLLITAKKKKYIGKKVAEWSLDLIPRSSHFDRRVTVTTPLQKAGAYLLTAAMDHGNSSNVVVWVADTVIIKKNLADQGTYYFVADAVDGRPIPNAVVELFGYRQEWKETRKTGEAAYLVHTRNFAEHTDANGQLILPRRGDGDDLRYQWLAIATTSDGRLAYLGFSGIWSVQYDYRYNQTKAYLITDRPVYRPGDSVKCKAWINRAQYDSEGPSPFAGKSFSLLIYNAKSEKIFEKNLIADEYGGISAEFSLDKDAPLGLYSMRVNSYGGGTFRVEEYKKPEFEVKISAPLEPVMLGEKITATIDANYYFGAPVIEATIKYKVLRTSYSAEWYPPARWDWLYGKGYWWFANNYLWYPGWHKWGCERPWPWWMVRPEVQPELVAEAEIPIRDGRATIEIDTMVAKIMQGDTDHRYEIIAEVTDLSRRTISGKGTVLVSRRAFKVYAWTDRGHYRTGDVVSAFFHARTLDGKAVRGKGVLRLFQISYRENSPVETELERWTVDPDQDGRSYQKMIAAEPGQYRLSYQLTGSTGPTIEGGYIFFVYGDDKKTGEFRFNDLELVPDKQEYCLGESVNLMINTDQRDSHVLLFLRPVNNIYLPPKLIRISGKSAYEKIEVLKKDMPNFFIEALTIRNGKVFQELRDIAVPPESRILNLSAEASSSQYKPGEKATLKIRVTDTSGDPVSGSVAVTVYDKAVEYISGGSNVPEIREFFWKWRRRHTLIQETTLGRIGYEIADRPMSYLGIFGYLTDQGLRENISDSSKLDGNIMVGRAMSAPLLSASLSGQLGEEKMKKETQALDMVVSGSEWTEPSIRMDFADTAFWNPLVTLDANGEAEVAFFMPENLTTWKARVWAMGEGTRVAEIEKEVITTKNLILRLQSPRFFVEKDEVVLSANIHNYLSSAKRVRAVLELEGGCLEQKRSLGRLFSSKELAQTITVSAHGEKRVDWRVKVVKPGMAVIRMKALTDEESDAMQMTFPVYIHGMLKTESWSKSLRPEESQTTISFTLPAERNPEQTRLEVRFSPTLAVAMVDALPYLADYPYQGTEQTLNAFLPAVITQKTLIRTGVNLRDIQQKRRNLNAQEIGDSQIRAQQWKRFPENPVFDEEELAKMVKSGITRLSVMQCADGGWGWFSGWGERSWPHTTAVVVRGLLVARDNGMAIVPGVLERGIEWLKQYQEGQITLLRNAMEKKNDLRWKSRADNLDAFIYMVLSEVQFSQKEMRDFLYRDRNELSLYGKAMFGFALHTSGEIEYRDMLLRNLAQYLEEDEENQTAWLRMPEGNYWWYWYGNEIEADAYYLKLLSAATPNNPVASRLVKYLLNNRKHATYWNSTRDTALVVEAFADYLKASGEESPDLTVSLFLNGAMKKEVYINKENLFTFDNTFILESTALSTGTHTLEIRKTGTGPLYCNAYLTNFTREDPITKAGLEIKVERNYYRLVREEKSVKTPGSRGQVLDQRAEKYRRELLKDRSLLKSGDLIEVELEIESKNDYEYLLFEDRKAAGFEPVEVRSGYGDNDLGAYMELRDDRLVFFVRILPRGSHSLRYRMRAEIPGIFSALPAQASAIYAPELKANSHELKFRIEER